MKILVLGGTSWLGGEVARVGLERDHSVTCLARGVSGQAPLGVTFVSADREEDSAYELVHDQDWDGVVDVSWQPRFVRGAVSALAERTARWVYVSSCSVYGAHDTIGADESAFLLPALTGDHATRDSYGEAKVACERLVLEGNGRDKTVIARAGLIGGPGDHTDRTGYWPWRFAHPAAEDGSVLVPVAQDGLTQVVDVRDLARWLVRSIEDSAAGVFNVAGPATPLAEHLRIARAVAGHAGPLVEVTDQWLLEHDVQEWAGQRSIPLWLHTPGWEGFGARSTQAAVGAGLSCRPLEQTLADVLAWEVARVRPRPRQAGLEAEDERQLIEAANG
ncbi:MAG: NAD-dependent epimerase/dehydratase family protein [Actinomycetota bacterium]